MDFLNCYICNAETKLEASVRIKTKTRYSGVGMNEIIQTFLKETHMLRFSPNDIVCIRCVQKINQYDLACRMANEIQQDIINSLYVTEQQCLSEQPVEFLVDVHVDKDSCEKDFEEFQANYDIENSIEHMHSNTSSDEPHSSNTIASMDIDVDNRLIKDLLQDKNARRRGCTSCEDCDIPFITKKELKQHQLKYHTPKKCGVCQQQFPNQMDLRAHIKTFHEIDHNSDDEADDSSAKESECNFRCDTCGIFESSEESLSDHVALHEDQLKCVVCGTILKHKANLVLHMRIHTDKKFFKCDKCKKTFVHKSSLRMHLQTTHTDVRKKQCPECPLRFKTTSQLNQHLVTHTGEKRHQCPECGKAFGQKYNMTAHYKSHLFREAQRKERMQSTIGSNEIITDD